MELINIFINPKKENTCFLCFNETFDTISTRLKLGIKSKFLDDYLSLADMMTYLFPTLELTLTQACKGCIDLIIKMYITIHRNNITKKVLNIIIDTVNKGISTRDLSNLEPCSVNINFATILDSLLKKQKPIAKSSGNMEMYENKINSLTESVPSVLLEDDFNAEKQCPHCFSLFDNDKDYKSHVKNHSWRRKKVYHNCSYCNYRTLCKQSLQGHINKNHLKIRPFVCDICYKNFYHKKNLVEHQVCHNQSRKYICDICGETFKHTKNLQEHLKLHSGERPYNCEICGKTFVTSGRRLEHIKRSHSTKDVYCLLCDKKFSLNKELTRHMKNVHS